MAAAIEEPSIRGAVESGEGQANAAYRLLRRWITSCHLPPSAVAYLGDVQVQTGFGRAPACEVSLRLEKDGLTETMPCSGYRIKPMTPGSISCSFPSGRKSPR